MSAENLSEPTAADLAARSAESGRAVPRAQRAAHVGWLRIRTVARRHAFVLQRNPQRWFDVVVWPVVDSILFGAIGVYFGSLKGGASAEEAGAAFLLSGIVLFHVVFQAEISLATGFMEETWSRNLLNLMVTPLREGEYVAGIMLFGLAKLVMGVGTVTIVAFVLFAFDITTLGLALIPMVALLLVVGWAVGLLVIGLILRVGQGAEILAWGAIALILPLSGIFYPVSALPDALQPIAQALPTTHIFAASRSVVEGHGLPWDQLGIAAAETVVLCVLSVWFVIRMLDVFRRRGYISRHV
jgi:ABC-2 type transport system permease protein